MQIIKCTRDALLKPLQVVGGIIEGRQTMQILSNILIHKVGTNVEFTTTDLEIEIKTSAQIGIGDEEVLTTVPAAKLIALLNAIPGGSTEVVLVKEEKRMVLLANSSRFSLSQQVAEDYPALPKSPCDTEVKLPSKILHRLMQMVHFAMAVQDIRYYLNGLLFVVGDHFVRSVATDGHRLACCDAQSETEFADPIEAILPRKTVLQLMKLLPDTDEEVTIQIGAGQVHFLFKDIELISKLIEGKYPDYTHVIPTNNDKSFLVDREQLIGSLKRAAILANEKFKGLRWIISKNLLCIQAANSDNEEAREEITINYDSDELDLGFNVTYLLDVLGNLKNKEVRFSFANAQGATLMTMPESEQFRYVLMPMRI